MAVQINRINPTQNLLNEQESNLVSSKEMTRLFGLPEDFIQFFVYNNNGTLLNQNTNFQKYVLDNNKIVELDPEQNIIDLGYQIGTYQLVYNLLRPVITKNPNLDLFIKSISQDRKEIKIGYTGNQDTFYTDSLTYINRIQNRNYFVEFYLDFGNNNLVAGLKIAVERDSNNNTFLIIKLDQPLPAQYALNFPLNIVEEISNTIVYEAVLTQDPVEPEFPSLSQANFSINVDDQRIGSSEYYNKESIVKFPESASVISALASLSASNASINVDYTDFANFVHFSSISQRIDTFYEKIKQIEEYQQEIDNYPSSFDNTLYKTKIKNVIGSFDDYEKYLYYETGSIAWPKSNTEKPYNLYSYTASQTDLWYNDLHYSASYYDEYNPNNLINGLPIYIQEKDDFQNIKPFIHSMGQLFDDIWLYIKAYTDLWKSENKLTEGISKDLVDNALQSLGISLFTDGDQDNIDLWLNGMNEEGKYTFQTSSLEPNITQVITGSQYTLSGQQESKNLFKRIYHNLPTLLKSRGTSKFFNYFNTLYGTPETILYPQEYGGVDKTNSSVEYIYDKFTYSIKPPTGSIIEINNISSSLSSYEIRVYPEYSLVTQSISKQNTLWDLNLHYSNQNGLDYGIINLNYEDPFNPGTYIILETDPLPIFVTGSNGELNWWNVGVISSGSNLNLVVKSKKDQEITFTSSVSYNFSPSTSVPLLGSVPSEKIEIGNNSTGGEWYGKFQEVRGWSEPITENTLVKHTLNPESYVGNTTSSVVENLLYRFPLGNDLNTYNHTTTTSLSGVQPTTSTTTLDFTGTWSETDYVSHTEKYAALPAVGGYSTPVTDKIRIESSSLATNTLYPSKSVVYPHPVSSSRTQDIHLTQTGLSPQDQVNNDIIAHLGDTYNLDDIIGDPGLADKVSYRELDKIRTDYFNKYTRKFNYKDFLQLVETFHKSLWRYVSQSTPARSTEATGLVIKPHILERSKVQRHEPNVSTSSYYETSLKIGSITGSNPGDYCCTRNSPWNEGFYNGQITGSLINISENYTKNPYNIFDPNNDPIVDDIIITTPIELDGSPLDHYDIDLPTPGTYKLSFVLSSLKDDLLIYDDNGVLLNRILFYSTYPPTSTADESGPGAYDILITSNTTRIQLYNLFTWDPVDYFSNPNPANISIDSIRISKINTRNEAYESQYAGYNPLTNNVTDGLLSRVKFREIKQGKKINPDNICGTCARYQVNMMTAAPGFSGYSYVNCTTGATINVSAGTGTYYINSCTKPTFLNTAGGTGGYILFQNFLPQYIENPSYFDSYEFNDSQLTETSYKRSRYEGVKLESSGFNEPLLNGSIPGTGSQTNVSNYSSYIAYAEGAGNSLAGRYGSTNYKIKWLIDESGSVYKPEVSSSYHWDGELVFGADAPVYLSTYNNSTGLQDYETTIHKPFVTYYPILYTDTGSRGTDELVYGSFSEISFLNGESVPAGQAYNFYATNTATDPNLYVGDTRFEEVTLTFPTLDKNDYDLIEYDSTRTIATLTKSPTNVLRISIWNSVRVGSASDNDNWDITTRLYKNGNVIAQKKVQIDGGDDTTVWNVDLNADLSLNQGDQLQVKVVIDSVDNYMHYINLIRETDGKLDFKITETTNPNTLFTINNYWTPTVDRRGLLFSTNLSNNLGRKQDPNVTNMTQGSGFSAPLEFYPQKNDQIRFEGNENYVYTIVDFGLTESQITLPGGFIMTITGYTITLDRPISNFINTDYFVIRRPVFNIGSIMVNNRPDDVSIAGTSPAFLIPKYIKPEFKEKIPNIISDLSQKGLI